MIVLKIVAKRDSEWFTDSVWGEGWTEYFTSGSIVLRRTAERKKNALSLSPPHSVDAIKYIITWLVFVTDITSALIG